MKVILYTSQNAHRAPLYPQPCVVTIGNFDGMHLGHQQIIERTLARAQHSRLPAVAILFEPQPLEFMRPEKAPPRLTPLREKCELLKKMGIDAVLCVRFNTDFARWRPDAFIDRILVQGLQAKAVVVGEDFRFGHQRTAGITELIERSATAGFAVEAVPLLAVKGDRVSSTRIRQALANGDLTLAKQLLGRYYRLQGRVVVGDQRGRLLGYPTANLNLHHKRLPLAGVFAVNIYGAQAEDHALPGVANIGVRPTVAGTSLRVEVHIFNFARSIYGQRLQVEFLHKLRAEQKFDSLEALKAQIDQDATAAREYFRK